MHKPGLSAYDCHEYPREANSLFRIDYFLKCKSAHQETQQLRDFQIENWIGCGRTCLRAPLVQYEFPDPQFPDPLCEFASFGFQELFVCHSWLFPLHVILDQYKSLLQKHAKKHISNGKFMRTRQKWRCDTFVWNACKSRCTPVKWDSFLKSPRQHPERDRNEIQLCIIWGHWGTRQGSTPGRPTIFLIGVPDVLQHLKNEIHAWKTRLAWI